MLICGGCAGRLVPGVKLVDAPGLHDDNSCRANQVKKQLHEADAVWLCSNIRRAVNDKTTKDLMALSLRCVASPGWLFPIPTCRLQAAHSCCVACGVC